METKRKLFFTFMFVIVLVGGLYMFSDWFSKVTGYFTGESEQERLANCLVGKGAQFYYEVYCADCEKQQVIFGKAFDKVERIDCGENLSLCSNLRSVPAWYINQSFVYGLKNESELRKISGCVD